MRARAHLSALILIAVQGEAEEDFWADVHVRYWITWRVTLIRPSSAKNASYHDQDPQLPNPLHSQIQLTISCNWMTLENMCFTILHIVHPTKRKSPEILLCKTSTTSHKLFRNSSKSNKIRVEHHGSLHGICHCWSVAAAFTSISDERRSSAPAPPLCAIQTPLIWDDTGTGSITYHRSLYFRSNS